MIILYLVCGYIVFTGYMVVFSFVVILCLLVIWLYSAKSVAENNIS